MTSPTSPAENGSAARVVVTGRDRARWLVPGAGLAAVLVGMLWATARIDERLAWIGIIIVGIWFTAMVGGAFVARVPRVHSRLQFGLMLAMGLTGLVVLAAIFLGAGG